MKTGKKIIISSAIISCLSISGFAFDWNLDGNLRMTTNLVAGNNLIAGNCDDTGAVNCIGAGAHNSSVSGSYSLTLGDYCGAHGYSSLACGWSCTVFGNASMAFGASVGANADFAIAMGEYAVANHDNTFIWNDGSLQPHPIYQYSSAETTTNKQFSVFASNGIRLNSGTNGATVKIEGDLEVTKSAEIGDDLVVRDNLIVGNCDDTGAVNCIGIGAYNSSVSGENSITLGNYCGAHGNNSFACGGSATVFGNYSMVFGASLGANADYAIVLGDQAVANHDHTFIWNDGTLQPHPVYQYSSAETPTNKTFNVFASNGINLVTGTNATITINSEDLEELIKRIALENCVAK